MIYIPIAFIATLAVFACCVGIVSLVKLLTLTVSPLLGVAVGISLLVSLSVGVVIFIEYLIRRSLR